MSLYPSTSIKSSKGVINVLTRIPNCLLTEFKDWTSFRLAVTFLSLVNPTTAISKDGTAYILTVKQSTLARLSGLSVPTIKRALSKLSANGFVSFATRSHRADGKLGVTLYYINKNVSESRYFCVERKALSQISSSKAFYVYCLCCKLAITSQGELHNSFFHSYSDIAALLISNGLSVSRSATINIIKELVSLNLIRRKRVRCSQGDYTDNKYTVVPFIVGRIKKKGIKKVRVCSQHTRTTSITSSKKVIVLNVEDIVTHSEKNVKPPTKNYYFFVARGSP